MRHFPHRACHFLPPGQPAFARPAELDDLSRPGHGKVWQRMEYQVCTDNPMYDWYDCCFGAVTERDVDVALAELASGTVELMGSVFV